MIAALISVAIMVVVFIRYGVRDEADVPKPTATQQPHVGTQHHTTDKPAHEGGKPAPLQTFANAKEGDWLAYRVTTESSLAPTITATGIERITNVTERTVARAFVGRIDATGEVRKDRSEDRPRQGLTIDQLTGNDIGGWT